jgi:hypothetical protein
MGVSGNVDDPSALDVKKGRAGVEAHAASPGKNLVSNKWGDLLPVRKIFDALPRDKPIPENKTCFVLKIYDPAFLLLGKWNDFPFPPFLRRTQRSKINHGGVLSGVISIGNTSSFPGRRGQQFIFFSKAQCLADAVAQAIRPHLREIDAQIALVRYVASGIKPHGAVGAGPYAMLAAGAQILVDDHDSVFFSFAYGFGVCAARPQASRPLALLADLVGELQPAISIFPFICPKNRIPELPPAQAMNQLTGGHAGHTTRAAFRIEKQGQLTHFILNP